MNLRASLVTIEEMRTALLARCAWGVVNGSAVEVRPGGCVTADEVRSYVRSLGLGERAASRVVAMPALRCSKLKAAEV